jgi:hypothetical protein
VGRRGHRPDLGSGRLGEYKTLELPSHPHHREVGDVGGPIKDVRATVERYPYLELERNQTYDLSRIPSGAGAA